MSVHAVPAPLLQPHSPMVFCSCYHQLVRHHVCTILTSHLLSLGLALCCPICLVTLYRDSCPTLRKLLFKRSCAATTTAPKRA